METSTIKNKIRIILLFPFILAGIGAMSLFSYFYDDPMDYLLIGVGVAFGVVLWYLEVNLICKIISDTTSQSKDKKEE